VLVESIAETSEPTRARDCGVAVPKMYLLLSEVWTMTDPRDLRRLVDYAVVAEQAGFHGIMIGEHVVHGPSAEFRGPPKNARMWLRDGNQSPMYPHPASLPLLSAMASVTTRVRLMAAAVLAPLRHPLQLAKDLATVDLITEGRLIVIPGVSWQREEYAALDVPFQQRGRILDEELEIWEALWQSGSPVSYHGTHFDFSDAYVEPQPYRPGGPELWIGSAGTSPWAVRRAVRYGKGFFPVLHPTPDEIAMVKAALQQAGRDLNEFEFGALLFGGRFKGPDDLLELDETLAPMGQMLADGFTTFVIKPSQHIDDGAEMDSFCRGVMAKVERLG
jgi:probable F420-dependent oxidoreductase